MPKYQLTYFNARARGEISRLAFIAADVKFEDRRLEFSEWPEEKKKSPAGTLPYLMVDGKIMSAQSMAIVRHLAREFRLYGKNNLDMLRVDEILEIVVDLMSKLSGFFEQDETKKSELIKEFKEVLIPSIFDKFDKLIGAFGKDGFAVGKELTVADLAIVAAVDTSTRADLLDKYPKLKANRDKTLANKRIAEYMKKRPATDF